MDITEERLRAFEMMEIGFSVWKGSERVITRKWCSFLQGNSSRCAWFGPGSRCLRAAGPGHYFDLEAGGLLQPIVSVSSTYSELVGTKLTRLGAGQLVLLLANHSARFKTRLCIKHAYIYNIYIYIYMYTLDIYIKHTCFTLFGGVITSQWSGMEGRNGISKRVSGWELWTTYYSDSLSRMGVLFLTWGTLSMLIFFHILNVNWRPIKSIFSKNHPSFQSRRHDLMHESLEIPRRKYESNLARVHKSSWAKNKKSMHYSSKQPESINPTTS
jgi:hypothetical protein